MKKLKVYFENIMGIIVRWKEKGNIKYKKSKIPRSMELMWLRSMYEEAKSQLSEAIDGEIILEKSMELGNYILALKSDEGVDFYMRFIEKKRNNVGL